MWLEAILTREDLEGIVEKFSPLEIVLGDSGSLLLVGPCEVSLTPEQGVAVKCDATLRWPVLGFDVPVSMHGLLVHVLPSVEERADGSTLVFRLQIDHAGVAMLPSFFDHGVTARVNRELEEKHIELAWNFAHTLSHVFKLPPSLASAAALSLRATAGRVKATEAALGLAADFTVSVQARGKVSDQNASKGADPAPFLPDGTESAARVEGDRTQKAAGPQSAFDSRSLAIGAAAAWLLLATLRAVRGAGKSRRGWRV
jgi:hypothetical protein